MQRMLILRLSNGWHLYVRYAGMETSEGVTTQLREKRVEFSCSLCMKHCPALPTPLLHRPHL